jgi:hypothetical protein
MIKEFEKNIIICTLSSSCFVSLSTLLTTSECLPCFVARTRTLHQKKKKKKKKEGAEERGWEKDMRSSIFL